MIKIADFTGKVGGKGVNISLNMAGNLASMISQVTAQLMTMNTEMTKSVTLSSAISTGLTKGFGAQMKQSLSQHQQLMQGLSQGFIGLQRSISEVTAGITKMGTASKNSAKGARELTDSVRTLATINAGRSLQDIGTGFERFGSRVLGGFVKLGKGIAKSSTEFQGYRAQLTTLFKEEMNYEKFKGGSKTEAEFSKIRKYAAETPFEVKDLTQASIAFRTLNIDPYKMYKSSSLRDENGKAKERPFMYYVGDLAKAFDKDLKQAEFSIQGALLGNWRSFNQVFLPKQAVEQVLGRSLEISSGTKADIDKTMNYIVEFIDKTYGGSMERFAKTTEGITSNILDNWNMIKAALGETGFMRSVNDVLEELQNTLMDLNSTDTTWATAVAKGLAGIANPAERLAHLATITIKWLAQLSETAPNLTQLLVTSSAALGGVVFLVGKLISMSGGFLMAVSSIQYMRLAFKELYGKDGKDVSFFGGLIKDLGGVIGWLTKLGIIAGVVYLAWNSDFFGMRTE
jgi:methyl-accepting chemotaxis protein